VTGSGAEIAEVELGDGPELEVEVTWMQPYLAYMLNKKLP
jgi:hypothetical protein